MIVVLARGIATLFYSLLIGARGGGGHSLVLIPEHFLANLGMIFLALIYNEKQLCQKLLHKFD
jgi:hypothetical protein